MCSFMSVFFSSMRRNVARRLTACVLLLGSLHLGSLKGWGTTQLLESSMKTSLSIIPRKALSSTDMVDLSSSGVC